MWRRRLLAQLNQWKFAPEFRIDHGRNGESVKAFHALAKRMRQAIPVQLEPDQPQALRELRSDAPYDTEFLLGICNGFFRLASNASQLGQSDDAKVIRNIGRAIDTFNELLDEHGIECVDMKGQLFDPRRNDFDIIGAPEERVGVERMAIERCERPAIFRHGELLQRGRGIVICPVSAAPNQPLE